MWPAQDKTRTIETRIGDTRTIGFKRENCPICKQLLEPAESCWPNPVKPVALQSGRSGRSAGRGHDQHVALPAQQPEPPTPQPCEAAASPMAPTRSESSPSAHCPSMLWRVFPAVGYPSLVPAGPSLRLPQLGRQTRLQGERARGRLRAGRLQ